VTPDTHSRNGKGSVPDVEPDRGEPPDGRTVQPSQPASGVPLPHGGLPVDNGPPLPVGLPAPVATGASRLADQEAAPGAALVAYDSHTRTWRLCLAVAGGLGLVALVGALAVLRNYRLSQSGTSEPTGSGGLAGTLIHPHARPSYTLVFFVASLAITLMGVVFAVATHDPLAPRLRVARRRTALAVKEYGAALDQYTLKHLTVEQAHMVRGASIASMLQIERNKHLRWSHAGRAGRRAGEVGQVNSPEPYPSSFGPTVDGLLGERRLPPTD